MGSPSRRSVSFNTRLRVNDGYIQIGSIGGVCTHPRYRGFRLASRLLDYCAETLRQNGARLMLISGDRGLYTRVGNVMAGRYATFTFTSPPAGAQPAGMRLRPATRADVALCSALYQAEPVHFERGIARFRRYFARNDGRPGRGEVIVEMDGLPAAYMILKRPWSEDEQSEGGTRFVHEYAGSREALAWGAQQVVAEHHLQTLTFAVPWQDRDLIHLLKQGGSQPN